MGEQKMRDTLIIRVDHSGQHPYIPVSRKTVRHLSADLQALGLLVYFLDKPDDWRVRPNALAKDLRVGVATVYRILSRMLKAGYIHRELIKRNDCGRFQTGAVYVVFEDRDYRREWQDRQRFPRTPVGDGHLGSLPNAEIPF